MAFPTTSSVFREWNKSILGARPTSYVDLGADTVKAALYNNTGSPTKDDAGNITGYNAAASPWVVANEQTSSSQWPAGGVALASKTFTTPSTGVAMFDAADTAGSGNVTLSGVMGCLVYDDTISGTNPVAKQGVCFNYFGGAQSVTGGTFTIVWNANGLARWTSS
jgi:hypothetical protein